VAQADSARAKFSVGQLIRHRLFHYRGVIADVDPVFQGSAEWYEQVARSRPPKDQPWYRVLVHDAAHETYVAERNLEPDPSDDPVSHPGIDTYFAGFRDGEYVTRRSVN
jgi:heat shock protein HspQ